MNRDIEELIEAGSWMIDDSNDLTQEDLTYFLNRFPGIHEDTVLELVRLSFSAGVKVGFDMRENEID